MTRAGEMVILHFQTAHAFGASSLASTDDGLKISGDSRTRRTPVMKLG